MSAWNYADWYAKNKQRLSEKHKARYRDDEKYRAGVRKRAAAHYKSHRKRMAPVDRHMIRSADGVNYVTIGRVARAIRRNVQVVRGYHRRGVIPEALYMDKRGWRLYTRSQLFLLVNQFALVDEGNQNLQALAKNVKSNWRA